MITVQLLKNLEKAIKNGHPWIFRNALKPFSAAPGSVVTVFDRSGRFCCAGLADEGPIGVRVFSLADSPIDHTLFSQRINDALALRDRLGLRDTDALRLIHGEGDFLPGIVLDRYGRYAVLNFDGKALLSWKETIVSALKPALMDRGVDTLLFRRKKQHEKEVSVLYGCMPEGLVRVREYGMYLWADLVNGQKTGLFLDHRESRKRVRTLSKGKTALNLYGYTGGFSVAAGLGGALSVTTVDSAPEAIRLAEKTWAENGLCPEEHLAVTADVATFMKTGNRKKYDLIIADPPSFAPRKSAVPNAVRAYQMLHASVLGALNPGGVYIAASCSSHINGTVFEKTLQDAAYKAGKKIRIVEKWGAGRDHPVRKGFPEGEYLKVFQVEAGNTTAYA